MAASALPSGWSEQNDALVREIQCADFVEALARVQEIGRLAERANHHPDITISYRTVRLNLCTHSAGHTVTPKDIELAGQIEAIDPAAVHARAAELRARFQH
jgi:4a-hydroxytetrahydrobiopterin dehydratase